METLFLHLQAIFTILLFTGIFRDNLGYRFAESTYVGLFRCV